MGLMNNKGGATTFKPECIFFTSNRPVEEWYPERSEIDAFHARITNMRITQVDPERQQEFFRSRRAALDARSRRAVSRSRSPRRASPPRLRAEPDAGRLTPPIDDLDTFWDEEIQRELARIDLNAGLASSPPL